MSKNIWIRFIIPFLIVCTVIVVIFLKFGSIEQDISEKIQSSQTKLSYFCLLSFLFLFSDVLLPIPSSFVMYMNGYVLGLIPGALLSYIALMCSSVIAYYIGYIGAIKIKEESRNIFKNSSVPYILFLTRGIPILSESFCILCGYARYPFRKYIFYCLIAYIPVVLIYAYFGTIANQKDAFFVVLIFSFLISFLFWLKAKKIKTS